MASDRRDVGRVDRATYTGRRGQPSRGEAGSLSQAMDELEDSSRDDQSRLERAREIVARRRRQAQARAAAAAKAAREQGSESGRSALRDLRAQLRGEGIDVAALNDGREKSRNQEVAERAMRAATVSQPIDATLETTGDQRVISEMAKPDAARSEALVLGVGMGAGPGEEPLLLDAGGGIGLDFGDDRPIDGARGRRVRPDDEALGPLEFADPMGVTGGGDR